jgi:hypothetical protein
VSQSMPGDSWKIERSGTFDGFEIVGWRYSDLAIWHIKCWSKTGKDPAKAFMVAGGEFYPVTVSEEERFAILHVLSLRDTAARAQSLPSSPYRPSDSPS